MYKQVIRQGDVVVFIRAHEHARADQGSFLVEEVIQPGFQSEVGVRVPGDYARTAAAQGLSPTARITPIERRGGDDGDTLHKRSAVGAPWQLVSVDALCHDPKQRGFVPVIVAPGFLGDPDHWCWWDCDYPDDGSIGPYKSSGEAIAEIERIEKEPGASHFFVAITDETLTGVYSAQRNLVAGEAGKVTWSSRRPRKQTAFEHQMENLNRLEIVRRVIELGRTGQVLITCNGGAWRFDLAASHPENGREVRLSMSADDFFAGADQAIRALELLKEGK